MRLFPDVLSVDHLNTILSNVDLTDREGGLSFDWHGRKLMQRVSSRAESGEAIA